MSLQPFGDLRERLKSGRAELAAAFLEKRATHYLTRHAALVDSVLIELSTRLALPPSFCVAAVGGYGRGELFPGSDVDVLLLLPHDPEPGQQATLEAWVQACWDVGLEIGHSVRTVDACLAEAADITVETNLLEARFVCGAAGLFDEFGRCFQTRFDAQRFFDGKLAEQHARHARFDDSAYKLEPNLKDSPGGLRDLHTIHWLAQACGLLGGWSGIARAGLLTHAEARRIARDLHGQRRQLTGAFAQAGTRQRAAMRAKRIRRDDVRPGGDVVRMDRFFLMRLVKFHVLCRSNCCKFFRSEPSALWAAMKSNALKAE